MSDDRLDAIEKALQELRSREQNNMIAIGSSLSGYEALICGIMAGIAHLRRSPSAEELLQLLDLPPSSPYWQHYSLWQQVTLVCRERARRALMGQLALAGPPPSTVVH